MAEEAPKALSGVTAARATSFIYQNAPKKAPPKPLLPPNTGISPTIRFTRWAALIVGVTYGFYHNRSLVKREEKRHDAEAKRKVIEDPIRAREKALRTREEMLTLAREVGVEVPADFETQFSLPDGKTVIVKNHH